MAKTEKIKFFFKISKSKEYANYQNLHNGDDLKRYDELKNLTDSDKFKQKKAYYFDKKKFEKTPEYKQLQEFNELKKSDKVKWYYKTKKSKILKKALYWQPTFSEDFSNSSIDIKKWITSYYWGKMLLKDSYALENDKHYFKAKGNLSFDSSILKIETKKETVEGKVWNPSVGFYDKKFNYTSGIINTGESFRQKFGLFKAKIKANYTPGVSHAFWMQSGKMLPQVDILNFNLKAEQKLTMNNYWKKVNDGQTVEQNNSIIKGFNPEKDYYIYSIEWKENQLIWKINNVVVKRSKEGVPNEPMYLNLSSGINQKQEPENLPGKLEVDWVKCYKEQG